MSFWRAIVLLWAAFFTMMVLTPHERAREDLPITVWVAFLASGLWALFAAWP